MIAGLYEGLLVALCRLRIDKTLSKSIRSDSMADWLTWLIVKEGPPTV